MYYSLLSKHPNSPCKMSFSSTTKYPDPTRSPILATIARWWTLALSATVASPWKKPGYSMGWVFYKRSRLWAARWRQRMYPFPRKRLLGVEFSLGLNISHNQDWLFNFPFFFWRLDLIRLYRSLSFSLSLFLCLSCFPKIAISFFFSNWIFFSPTQSITKACNYFLPSLNFHSFWIG